MSCRSIYLDAVDAGGGGMADLHSETTSIDDEYHEVKEDCYEASSESGKSDHSRDDKADQDNTTITKSGYQTLLVMWSGVFVHKSCQIFFPFS